MLPTQCLCTKLRRAARSVSRFYDEALADTGLKVAQFSLLRHLQRLDRPSISELAEAMGLDRSTLGRNLRVLEGDGLLRLTGGEDQRNRLVELTPAGLDALERGTPAWEDAQRRLAGRLGEERSVWRESMRFHRSQPTTVITSCSDSCRLPRAITLSMKASASAAASAHLSTCAGTLSRSSAIVRTWRS